MSRIPNNKYWNKPNLYPFTDKEVAVDNYTKYFLDKTLHLFEWKNLPKTIPQRELELILQTFGSGTFATVNGELYVFKANLGGMPNEYYFPTLSIIANPYLKYNAELKIDEECIVMFNDSLLSGVIPLANKYITQMVENDITQNLANINMRLINIIACKDDDDKAEAERFIEDIIKGKLSALQSEEFFGAIQTQPYGSTGQSNQVTQLIEYAQWLRTSLLQEFGIRTENGNVKREYVNADEIGMNDTNSFLLYDMLYNRKLACEKVNDMFGTDIQVDYSELIKEQMKEDDDSEYQNEDESSPDPGEDDNEEGDQNADE